MQFVCQQIGRHSKTPKHHQIVVKDGDSSLNMSAERGGKFLETRGKVSKTFLPSIRCGLWSCQNTPGQVNGLVMIPPCENGWGNSRFLSDERRRSHVCRNSDSGFQAMGLSCQTRSRSLLGNSSWHQRGVKGQYFLQRRMTCWDYRVKRNLLL